MNIKVKKLHPDAKLPVYNHFGDSGMDIFALEQVTINPGERAQIRTGIAIEYPENYVGLLWDKSGLSIKHGLKVFGGVFDYGYRGEYIVCIGNFSKEPYVFEKGHKVCQLLVQRIEYAGIVEVDKLSETERGSNSLGSSGK